VSVFFVTGSGTDIGKTHIACALLRAWRARGVACDALKPVVSGYDDGKPAGGDPALLLEALGRDVTAENIARIAPLRFTAPLAPPLAAKAERRAIDFDALIALCRARMLEARGPLLIEGAGGVMSPLSEGATVLDLIEELAAPVIFVAGSYLGAVSHALTGLETLELRAMLDKRASPLAALVVSESAASVGLAETIGMLEGQGYEEAWRAPRGAEAEWAAELTQYLDAYADG
jgi:dethiobiotin synthetase